MPGADTPQDADRLLAEALNRWDVEGALALYETGASFVPQPGQVLTGTDGIRQVLSGFIQMRPKFTLNDVKVIPADGVALLYNDWSMTGTGPDGSPVNMAGQGTEVVRRQPDGTWRFVIDSPFGIA